MSDLMKFYADEKNVRVLGRTIFRDNTRYLSYSCSAVEFMFTGTSVTADIWTDWNKNEEWQLIFQGFITVVIDDDFDNMRRIPVEMGTNTYTIFESDTVNTVKIRIMKLSEAAFGKVGITCISADGELSPTSPLDKRIEFIGDSITCGYGIEGVFNVDVFNTNTENPWNAYAARTSRLLNMEFQLVSWSGIGIISNWVPEDVNEPLNEWIMPDLYDYTDRGLENILGVTDDCQKEIWDNSRFNPHICVVNLGTNDQSYTRNIPERVNTFGENYLAFIRKIRAKNPDAYIVCTLGVMGQDLYPEVERRVSEMADPKVLSMPFDVQLESDGIGADWHPSLPTHIKMSEKLSAFIKNNCL